MSDTRRSWPVVSAVSAAVIAFVLVVLVTKTMTTEGQGTRSGNAAEEPLPKFKEYTSRSYTIYSDLPAAAVEPIANHMDVVFAEYSARFASFRPRSKKPMPIYIIKDREAYIRFLGSHDVEAANSAGMFVTGRKLAGLFVWTQGRDKSDVLQTLQHEGFHQFAWSYVGPNLPIWANEGIAEYFEDGLLAGNRLAVGLVNEFRVNAMRQAIESGKILSFDQMLNITSNEWSRTLSRDPETSRAMYNQAWSMVHFLVHANEGRYRPAFEQYLSLLNQGRSVEVAFKTAFGTSDTKAFEARWKEYVVKLEPDHMHVALERMEFLGTAIKALHAKSIPIPKTLDDLKAKLKELRFRSWRSVQGVRTQYSADDEDMYEFALPRGDKRKFEMLAPASDKLPPRLQARGMKPEPTLNWYIDPQTNELAYQIDLK